MTPERLYLELGRLIAETPELASGPITPEVQRWLSAAEALIRSSGSLADALQLGVAGQNLHGPLRARNADLISDVLHRAFAKAEADAPPELHGSVVLIGPDLDAYVAMRRLLGTATSNVLLVAPNAAGKILADYAILAPLRVTVRLLADEAQHKNSLIAGVQRWQLRFAEKHKLIARLAPANSLHEQLILLDDARAWLSGVPFSELAKRTHTGLVRMRPEDEARKIAVYAEIWEEATPLLPSNAQDGSE